MNAVIRFGIVVSVVCATVVVYAAEGPVEVKLSATRLADPNLVLSPADVDASAADRPVISYTAFDTQIILPRRKIDLADEKATATLKLALDSPGCPESIATFTRAGESVVLSADGKKTELKPAGLGFARVAAGRGELAFPRAFAFGGAVSVFCRSATAVSGTVGDQRITLYDDNLDGTFAKGADAVCVGDTGPVTIFAPLKDIIPTTQGAYQVRKVGGDGSALQLSPYPGEITGRLKVQSPSKDLQCYFALASASEPPLNNYGATSVAALATEAPLILPPEQYKVLYALLYRPAAKRIVAVITPGAETPIKVPSYGEVTVVLGETALADIMEAEKVLYRPLEAMLEIDLSTVEAACDAGDFDKAQKLFTGILDGHKPATANLAVSKAILDAMAGRLELETTPEATALRTMEAKLIAAAKAGNVEAVKPMVGELEKAFKAIPAKFANSPAMLPHKIRVEAAGRYATGNIPGLRATYFDHSFTKKTGAEVVDKVFWDKGPKGEQTQFLGTRYEGFLVIPADGQYELSLESDDGARMWLDGQQVIDHWKSHNLSEKTASVKLTAGLHPIKIESYQGLGTAALHFRWTPPGGRQMIVPAWALESGATAMSAPSGK